MFNTYVLSSVIQMVLNKAKIFYRHLDLQFKISIIFITAIISTGLHFVIEMKVHFFHWNLFFVNCHWKEQNNVTEGCMMKSKSDASPLKKRNTFFCIKVWLASSLNTYFLIAVLMHIITVMLPVSLECRQMLKILIFFSMQNE